MLQGEKIFIGPATIKGNVSVSGFINLLNLTDFVDDAVTLDGEQNITGHKHFRKRCTITSNLYMAGNLFVNEKVNNVNVSELGHDIMDKNGKQTITGKKMFTKPVVAKAEVQLRKLISGIKVPQDIVTSKEECDIQG